MPSIADAAAYRILLDHPIRYSDMDRQGHVNNAVYATYFEVARTEFLDRIEPQFIARGHLPVLAHIEIDFLRELIYPGTIKIGLAVLETGRASARFAQAVFADRCVASGVSVLVQLDAATRKPAPWSEAQRATLGRYALRDPER